MDEPEWHCGEWDKDYRAIWVMKEAPDAWTSK